AVGRRRDGPTVGLPHREPVAYYIVRKDEDGPHACVCIQVDDAAKLQALAADRGIDLAPFLPGEPPA
ncbi:hypothetical protein P1N98_00085, partial [Tsukamurella tyrosinosolvens]